ncbi:panB [Symbiodinium necroappetens]|uniref:PanB protein n=1 Tax=Symbiodinium necroappetens TaxID=1628268 RepID=A0A812M4S6_9DINO|nr:panB [Symbiodinium necroappetens]
MKQPLDAFYVIFQVLQNAVLIIPGVGNLLFRGPFAEITRGWYAIVGVTILMNMLLNCFVPAGVTVAKMIVNVFMRCFFRMGVAHQAELLELYTHPEFDIKQKYAQLLTTVFVTLMYGAGLPLLYFLACAFMFCQYWADKYCLLWGSRRPPHYDTKMATEAIESMLYAVPFHCVLAILMYGQTCVFPSNPLGGDLGNLVDEGSGYTPGMLQQFIPQVTREPAPLGAHRMRKQAVVFKRHFGFLIV